MTTPAGYQSYERGEKLDRQDSARTGVLRIQDQGVCTAVHIKDGRLDINLRWKRPWFASLSKRIEPVTHPTPATTPSTESGPQQETAFPLNLNIVIMVVGSRGDVQPFIAMGKELQKHGHRVRLATHLHFCKDVKGSGLEFFNIGGDPEELMAYMVKNPGLLPGLRTIRSGAIQKRRREMSNIFSGCWQACYEAGDGTSKHRTESSNTDAVDACPSPFVADAIIANPPCFVHLSCAEKLGVPLNVMFTMPWSPTQSFPHPLATIRSQNLRPSVANFLSYRVVEVMMWEGLGDLINHFRRRELGLDPLDAIQAPRVATRLQIPHSYLWSPSLLPKPPDWSSNIDVCGFQFLEHDPEYQPPDELERFLAAGDPPIYIGFGSIVADDPVKMMRILLDAVRQTGCRALISRGWSGIERNQTEIPDNIFLLEACPHDWLFRRVLCVVHHGGAGTTAAGLLLGRPTVIIPFFGDQLFWGSIVARAGAGPLPIPYKELTAEKLADAIRHALGEEIQKCARQLGAEMSRENGVKSAVESFHRHLDLDKLSCEICPDRPAVWYVRPLRIRLSALAASVLVHTKHIDPRDITLYRYRDYDTGRNPRGPISASAEVFYGLISDILFAMTHLPGQIVDLFQGLRRKPEKSDSGDRNWAITHFEECLMNQRRRQGNGTASSIIRADLEMQHAPEHSRENASLFQETDAANEESHEHADGPQPVHYLDSLYNEITMQAGDSKLSSQVSGGSKQATSEARHYAARSATYVLKFGLILPTDIMLSLTKGFHNAPKLYHDDRIEPLPRVVGIRSGFRAAGKEIHQSFYNGVTGLVTQPVYGFQSSGSKGLITGVGKGIGGFFLKPAAGLFGLVGLPLDGVQKHMRGYLSKSKSKDIILSRITQGIEEMGVASPQDQIGVVRKWDEIQRNAI